MHTEAGRGRSSSNIKQDCPQQTQQKTNTWRYGTPARAAVFGAGAGVD